MFDSAYGGYGGGGGMGGSYPQAFSPPRPPTPPRSASCPRFQRGPPTTSYQYSPRGAHPTEPPTFGQYVPQVPLTLPPSGFAEWVPENRVPKVEQYFVRSPAPYLEENAKEFQERMCPQKAVTLAGLGALLMLATIPVSDAVRLLRDFNYLHWGGASVPAAVIISLVVVLAIFVTVIVRRGVRGFSGRELARVAATFCLVFGLILGIASMVLFYKEIPISGALKYSCSGSIATQDASLHYANLMKLRESAACASKYSIVECKGYANAAPPEYTRYFQSMEEKYRCSGFCYADGHRKTALSESGAKTGPGADGDIDDDDDGANFCQTKVSVSAARDTDQIQMLQTKIAVDPASEDASASADAPAPTTTKGAAAATTAAPAAATTAAPATDATPGNTKSNGEARQLPPALFSQNAYKSSCDGAAARGLAFSAIGTSNAWCVMAMVLIGTSASLTFGEWFSSQ